MSAVWVSGLTPATRRWLSEVDRLQFYFVWGRRLPPAGFQFDQSHNPVSVLPGPIPRSDTDSSSIWTNDSIPSDDEFPEALQPVKLQHPRCDLRSPTTKLPVADSGPYDELEYQTDVLRRAKVDEAIYDLFTSEPEIAKRIVRRMHALPREHQTLMYHGGGDNDQNYGSESSFVQGNAFGGTSSQGRSATTHATASTSATTTDSGLESAQDQSGQGDSSKGRSRKKRKRAERTFACPFNKFMPRKFSTGRFVTCVNGWSEMKNLKTHIKAVHLRPQCPRCWRTFDTQLDCKNHASRIDQEFDCPDEHLQVNRIESVDHDVFNQIVDAVSIGRGKGAVNLPDVKRWYTVKNLIFAPAIYSTHFPDPDHPYCQDLDGDEMELQTNDWERLDKFANMLYQVKLEVARETHPEMQMHQLTLSVDDAKEVAKKSWLFMERTRTRENGSHSSHASVGLLSLGLDTEEDRRMLEPIRQDLERGE